MTWAALVLTPIGFLRRLNVVIESLKVVAIGTQVCGNREVPGQFDQGRMSSWII